MAPFNAKVASGVPAARAAAAIPSTTKAMLFTDEYATRRLKSVWAKEANAPKTIAAVARNASAPAKCFASAGYNGRMSLKKPYAPNFNRTPARIIEPAVGASVCASGSQVWKGHKGTLTAKAITNAQKAIVFTVLAGIPAIGAVYVDQFAMMNCRSYVLNRTPSNCTASKSPSDPPMV